MISKEKTRYDYNYLKKISEENNIELIGEYSKVNRDTIIRAKCLMIGCDKEAKKNFKNFVKYGGCFCKEHVSENKKKKTEQTCLKNLGVNHPSQSQEIKEKMKKTNLKRYGVEYSLQNTEVKEKTKQTNLKRYGVEYSLQNTKVKEKTKRTNLERYGVENPNKNKNIREKTKKTCIERYRVEYSLQNKEVREKMKKTNLKKYGVEYSLQNTEVKEKMKKTNLKRYGVEYPFQNTEVKEKTKQTNLEKYGVEYPSQNTEVSIKQSKNAYKLKSYIFPSGKEIKIQGYEHFMLNELINQENINEEDIKTNREDVPEIWYKDKNNKNHRYFVDCFIPSQKRCIEVKSTWTAQKKKDSVFIKKKAVEDAGYICEIWVYNAKGDKIVL